METVRRICLSRIKFIGDVVLTTPVIRSVREHFPEAHIAYLGEREAVTLLQNNPDLDEILSFDFSRPVVLEQPRVIFELRAKKFDVFVDFFCNPRTALLARTSGARVRIGKEVPGRGKLYTHRILDDGKPKSAIAFHYQYVEPLGVKPRSWQTKIFLKEEELREARNYLKWQDIDPSRPMIGLHPGATWPAKMWPWEKFADLADRIRAKLGMQVVVTQGPRDFDVIKNISGRVAGNVFFLPVVPLRQLAAILSLMEVYVANDNGTMHIGVAVGTPTIGIFGPGEENIWFPYPGSSDRGTQAHIALRKDVACHPCHLDFCNRTGREYMECMNLLSVDEVLQTIQSRLHLRRQ